MNQASKRVPVMGAGALAIVLMLVAAGCGGSGAGSPPVPALSGGGGQSASADPNRAAALRAAAQCVRAHGITDYQDPTLSAGGLLYADIRSVQNASQSAVSAARQACATALTRAALNLSPDVNEPPAPVALVQAGVQVAQCARAHGIPLMKDPTANSPYTPGHGFGMTASEVPAGGKGSAGFQQFRSACLAQIDAEIAASTLAALAGK
jgi:hypothetical protein